MQAIVWVWGGYWYEHSLVASRYCLSKPSANILKQLQIHRMQEALLINWSTSGHFVPRRCLWKLDFVFDCHYGCAKSLAQYISLHNIECLSLPGWCVINFLLSQFHFAGIKALVLPEGSTEERKPLLLPHHIYPQLVRSQQR